MEQPQDHWLDRWPHQAPLVRGEDDPLEPHLAASLSVASEACIAVAFILDRGLDLLRPYLVEFLERGGRLQILTGDYFGVTEPDGLRRLLDLEGKIDVEARIFETRGQAFHPKAYLFRVGPSEGIAYIGSSNLSRSALRDGVEWNYRVLRSANDGGFEEAWAEFERLFSHPKTKPLTHEWIQAYAATRRPSDHRAEIGVEEEPLETPRPRAIQVEALQALEDTRKNGAEAGLVVLATGLGKTWLSAFDVLAFAGERDKTVQELRVLFVAHREEILSQALDTYRRLAPQASLGKYTGTEKVSDAQILFASVQTLSRATHLRRFQRDEFDYIVVDEFHHAAAATYRKVIDYFHPGFLLGLTATPERTDGGDLLALCGQNLVYRCDLGRGVRGGELSPFQYYGVPDNEVDYSAVPWRSGRFVDTEGQLTDALTTNRRAQNALDEWRKRSGQRGIGFCCSVAHADFMAQFFREQGVRAVAVHSKKTSAPRTISLQQLDEGELEIVFCVDMFNEGVDVPNIDTILMLRPTESRIIWLQQFGRGLRLVKGKVLQVVDYIGNHKAFLSKVQSLLPAFFEEIGDSPASLRRALRALREGRLEFPPDCGITYELEAIEILEQLLRPTARSSELEAAYETFRDQHGERPTARELALQGTLTRASIKPFGSWFELVRDQGDLTYEEQAQLDQDQGLLATIEQSRMERSYKMLVLLAMMEEEVFPGSIGVERLAVRFQAIASRTPILRDELRETLGTKSDSLSSMLKGNPLRAWAGTKRGGGSAYFSLEDDEFSAAPAHAGSVADDASAAALTDMCRELAEWRLSDYIDRNTPKRVECQVVLDPSGAWSIRLDRSLYGGLPEGFVSTQVDGRSLLGHFDRSALTSLKEADRPEPRDLLPSLLSNWFAAPPATAPEDHSVILDLTQDPIRLQPGAGHRAQGAEVGVQYMREEIPLLFGLEFNTGAWRQGMVTIDSGMILLVTLNKSGKDDAHQYDDQFLSPSEFQWQSQNRTGQDSKQGRTLTGEDDSSRQIHLFARKEGKTRAGKAAPFIYCGELEFRRWEGEKPITVWWKLATPLSPTTVSAFQVGNELF